MSNLGLRRFLLNFVRLYRLLRLKTLLRYNISIMHLPMALTIVTFIRHVLLKLRYSVFIALVHPTSATTDFALFPSFLAQWLGHVLGVMDL
jgi:hypothetical protein